MILRGLISALVLIALTLSSFGHRTLSPGEEVQAETFILAGGDWAALCADGDDPLSTTAKCMACVIAQGCALPTPAAMATRLSVGDTIVWPRTTDQPVLAAQIHAHQARAPPLRLI